MSNLPQSADDVRYAEELRRRVDFGAHCGEESRFNRSAAPAVHVAADRDGRHQVVPEHRVAQDQDHKRGSESPLQLNMGVRPLASPRRF